MASILNEHYFDDKEFKDMSGAGIRDFVRMNPEAEYMAWEKAREIKGEASKLEHFLTMDNEALVGAMRKKAYGNDLDLRGVLIQRGESIVPLILEKFIRSMNDVFVEHAFTTVIGLNYDCEDYLLAQLSNIKSPYTQSIACHILGLLGSEKSIEVLKNHYENYKGNYPTENYEQGPLYGMWSLGRRLGHHVIAYKREEF